MIHLGTDYTSRSVARRRGSRHGNVYGGMFTAHDEATGHGSDARAVPERWRQVFKRAFNRAAKRAAKRDAALLPTTLPDGGNG